MGNADWMVRAGWGAFTHYLYKLFEIPDWDAAIAAFDVERLARKLAKTGCGYYFITLMQRDKYMLAPNTTYNRITGYAPGEACPHRDIIPELYRALVRYNIKLCLYYTGDGPLDDVQAGPAMGFTKQMEQDKIDVSDSFVQNWASVLEEYSRRYSDMVSAWWIDGCYPWLGYNEHKLGLLAKAARSGNPSAAVSLNCGVHERVSAYSLHDDFTTGEMDDFRDLPDSATVNSAQWHSLTHLGTAWAKNDLQISPEALSSYVHEVHRRGGALTIDLAITQDGDLFENQVTALSGIGSLRS